MFCLMRKVFLSGFRFCEAVAMLKIERNFSGRVVERGQLSPRVAVAAEANDVAVVIEVHPEDRE